VAAIADDQTRALRKTGGGEDLVGAIEPLLNPFDAREWVGLSGDDQEALRYRWPFVVLSANHRLLWSVDTPSRNPCGLIF
jgi:hypothetical protein